MTARTYTPEAIEALVKAAQDMVRLDGRDWVDARDAAIIALRPFTTEPSSWPAFCQELWGDDWSPVPTPAGYGWINGRRHVSPEDQKSARAAYRARYGVEP